MTLLSPLALLFGLAALVPLILHLYQKRQRTVMLFSTNRFFTESVTRSQRRLRLRRLLLLLLRVAACILLALALAQPVLSLFGFGGGAGDRDVVVLLDDSLSMQAVKRDQSPPVSRFDTARALALDALDGLENGDRAAIVTFTGRALGANRRSGLGFSNDLTGLADELKKLQPSAAAGDVRSAMHQAAALFKGAEQRTRLLLIASDLQAGDWRQSDLPQPDHPVACTLMRLDPPTQDNVAADAMILSQGTAVVGQPNLLRARLINYRPETTEADLVITVDAKDYVRRPVTLLGQSRHIERIPIVFDEPGEHQLELRVDCRDALPGDNVRYAAVRVNPRLPVLLVDGDVDIERGRSAAFFMRAALQAVNAENDGVLVDVIKPSDLSSVRLDTYRVAILSNVARLSVLELERLEGFVQAGGGLAIFAGHRADRAFYNEVMGSDSRPLGGLLPAELRSLVSSRDTVEPMHIVKAELDHPILQRFKGTLRSSLGSVDVYEAHAAQPRDGWVVAAMDKQLPLMVERSFGQGRVILFTTSPVPQWTNLPVRRVFIPLMNRLAGYLAGGGTADATYAVGRELVLLRGGWDYDRPIRVRRPDARQLTASVRMAGAEPVAYLPAELVDQVGFYQTQVPDDSRSASDSSGQGVAAVNVPRLESVPDALELGEALPITGNWQLKTVDLAGRPDEEDAAGRQAVAALLTGGRVSQGIWDPLLWIVLVLILIEPLIANRIIGPKASASPADQRRAA